MKRCLTLLGMLCVLAISLPIAAKQQKIEWVFGDRKFSMGGVLQTETGFTARSYLLNKNIPDDKIFVVKTKFDWTLDVIDPVSEMKVTLRNKAVWGSSKGLGTSFVYVPDIDASSSFGHRHDVPARMMWIREGWIKLDLTKLLAMDLPKQEFKIGSFSFYLGRGISLGDAYAVSPASLGFFQDFSVDQFAYGALLSGNLGSSSFLSYDAYVALLENKSTSISETLAQTQAAEFGRQNNPIRGFGVINWVFAARLKFDPLKDDNFTWHFEPYAMHNSAPEQKVEFLGDSQSSLGTIGMAMEFASNIFEFGFDAATNLGQQQIKGWDRNKIQKVNRQGISTFVYSDIYTVDPTTTVVTSADKAIYDPSNKAQVVAVNKVPRSPEENGQAIAGTTVYNGLTRFRPAFTNKYKGYMFVADAGMWLLPKRVMFSVGGGLSSGDINPNANIDDPQDEHVDGIYEGFIPLQEVYTGDRIRSTYVLGGGGLNRLLPAPNSGNRYSSVVDAFTNIIFVGASTRIITSFWGKPVVIQPNVLSYTSDVGTNKFDRDLGKTIDEPAGRHLGVEFNMFSTIDFTDALKSTFVWIVFVPGQQYKDTKGRPFSADQRKILDNFAGKRLPDDVPLLSSDTVFGASWLLAYSF